MLVRLVFAELSVDDLEHAARDHLADLLTLMHKQEMAFAWMGIAGLEADGTQLVFTVLGRRIESWIILDIDDHHGRIDWFLHWTAPCSQPRRRAAFFREALVRRDDLHGALPSTPLQLSST